MPIWIEPPSLYIYAQFLVDIVHSLLPQLLLLLLLLLLYNYNMNHRHHHSSLSGKDLWLTGLVFRVYMCVCFVLKSMCD